MPDKKIHASICRSLSVDPCLNLALEEHLLNRVQPDEIILHLWQNEKTVVIGRHQNAWKECRTDLLQAEGGKLVRRLSGGGAVYHDLGNLNFTFVMDRRLYDLQRQLRVILRAVRNFGIPAKFSGRNDLLAAEKKFSGNAFCFRGQSAYHHGTLLLHADFSRMGRYLQVSPEKISGKGIESVQARVINLSELSPAVSIDAMVQSLAESFAQTYGGGELAVEIDPARMGIETLRDKYASWDWTYGKSPVFDISFAKRFIWGEVEIGLRLKEGLIEEATVYSDAMDEEMISRICQTLPGIPLQKNAVLGRLTTLADNVQRHGQIADLNKWLAEKEF